MKLTEKDFKEIRNLGGGSYGEVSLIQLHGRYYALKTVEKAKVAGANKVANVHFERDVLEAANSLCIPEFNFTFQVS